MTKVGYLGPLGSFSEEAAGKVKADEYIAFPTIPKLLKAFWSGEVDKVVLPIENSIEGTVVPAVSSLINGNGNSFIIEGEIELPIKQNLIGIGRISEIRIAGSHPQALAQCVNFVEELGIKTESFDSTSAAAKQVAEKRDNSFAAIGTKRAAEIYDLKIIKENIQDSDNNVTRFLILGHEVNAQTGVDKTSIIFELNNRSGALAIVLVPLFLLRINMTQIISRPSKKVLGEYVFWIDFDGHQRKNKIKVALWIIKKATKSLTILGSYPKAEM